MRYGVISDIHGNLPALQAAVSHLKREGVDAWLCIGDIIGYGPNPNECVETVAELAAIAVAGNHELIILKQLTDSRSGRLAQETQPWTDSVLRDDCRAYLARLPRVVSSTGFVMAHGSLDDPEEYLTRAPRAADQLGRLEVEHPSASLLLVGHTHRPWAYSAERGTIDSSPEGQVPLGHHPLLLNPGSVGQSRMRERTPRARFLLLDLERRWARFYRTAFDVGASRAALREHGLPDACIHVHPGLVSTARRRGGRVLRSLAAGTGARRRRPEGEGR
jgi:predicted phosphodiesterase